MSNSNAIKMVSALSLAAGLLLSTQASAVAYSYSIDNPPGSANAGDVSNFSTTYQTGTEVLTVSSTIKKDNGKLADGFWLVLSDGPNPKHHFNEYAIFYGDGISGNLTSYVYNGVNSSNSWYNPGEFVESFAGGLTADYSVTDEVTFSFTIDASYINAYVPTTPGTNDWDGAMFGQNIGIWYHPAVFGTAPTYNQNGSLASFPVSSGGWYDTAYRWTNVPAPAISMLLLTGLIGMIGLGRRR